MIFECCTVAQDVLALNLNLHHTKIFCVICQLRDKDVENVMECCDNSWTMNIAHLRRSKTDNMASKKLKPTDTSLPAIFEWTSKTVN